MACCSSVCLLYANRAYTKIYGEFPLQIADIYCLAGGLTPFFASLLLLIWSATVLCLLAWLAWNVSADWGDDT